MHTDLRWSVFGAWWILKAARNCTQNTLRKPPNTNSRKENSYWFIATKDSLLLGRWDNKKTSTRGRPRHSPSKPSALHFPDGWELFALYHVLVKANALCPEECCFCDSFLAEITRQMLSLWHQRSGFKWREIKQNIKNKREKIDTSRLTFLHSDLCVHFLATLMVRIWSDESTFFTAICI